MPGSSNGSRSSLWREALLWAVVAAVAIEFILNFFSGRTLWQRVDNLQHRVEHLEKVLDQHK